MRRLLTIVTGLFLGTSLVAFPAAAQPTARFQLGPIASAPSDGYGPRFAPSGYQYDDGSLEITLGVTSGTDYAFASRFVAAGGADVLTSISIAWSPTIAGQAAKIHVWVGDATSLNLVYSQNVTVPSTPTGSFAVYPVTVPVSGMFFVGITKTAAFGEQGIQVDTTLPIVAGRAFVAARAAGTLDPAALSLQPLETLGFSLYHGIRAGGSNAGFTYQGKLESAGEPYTGTGDVQFKILDAATGGATVMPVFVVPGVAFNKGLFSARVPADASTFDPGADRWLEVAVRTPGGSGSFTTLTPRQRMTSAPTALAAMTARTAATAANVPWAGVTDVPTNVSSAFSPWVSTTGGINFTGGQVGIGASSPASALHVASSTGVSIGTNPTSGGGSALVLDLTAATSGAGRIQAIAAAGSAFGALLLNPAGGAVGVGVVPSPIHQLDVQASGNNLTGGFTSSSNLGTWLNIGNTSIGGRFWRLISTGSANGEGVGKLVLAHGTIPGTSLGNPMVITTGGVGIFTNTPNASFVLDVNGPLRCVGFTNASSARYKNDIQDYSSDILARFNQLRPVTFTWTDAIPSVAGKHDMGFIAEDVAALFPEAVSVVDGKVEGIDYTKITALSVQAIKQQDRKIDQLSAENKDLRERLERLEKALQRK